MIPFSSSQAYRGVTSVTRALFARVFRLLAPVSTDEDQRRREYILNIILAISICLLCILETTIIYNYITFDLGSYDGFGPIEFGLPILLCAGLLTASKYGYAQQSSYILIALYIIGVIYSGWTWGVSLPATLLATGLIIVTSSILIGSTFGFAMGGCMVIALTILGIHERMVLGLPSWHLERISITDLISYSSLFLFMSFIAWLSNREIDHSLIRARESEKLLKDERDNLEQRVASRAQELMSIEDARIRQLERSAEFGNVSQGLFHDLMSPLSSISMYMERLAENNAESKQNLEIMNKMISVARRMNSFMDNLRQYTKGLQSIQINEPVDLSEEIGMIRDIFSYKARMARTKMIFETPSTLVIQVNQTHIHQLLTNLLSNALEACEGLNVSTESQCVVTTHINSDLATDTITISVSDTGHGISQDNIRRLFKKPFTTKKHGTGTGLMTIAYIVEKELRGKITVESQVGVGTTFTITLPNILIYRHESQPSN
ncbi:MAG: HAMP domain-containing histidine kinase [Candidatus Pacebacteria bacterium]|nr:HAMP domain-containing histidine kinase [Candidatus Paceibacterota bacterium]